MDVARASGDEIWTKSDIDREEIDVDRKKLISIEKSRLLDATSVRYCQTPSLYAKTLSDLVLGSGSKRITFCVDGVRAARALSMQNVNLLGPWLCRQISVDREKFDF